MKLGVSHAGLVDFAFSLAHLTSYGMRGYCTSTVGVRPRPSDELCGLVRTAHGVATAFPFSCWRARWRCQINSVQLSALSLSLAPPGYASFSSRLSLPLFSSSLSPPERSISNMARGKKGANGNGPAPAAESTSDSTATPPPRSILPITPTPSKDRDVVKVNNSSLVELKNALDDAIKRVRSVRTPRSAIA